MLSTTRSNNRRGFELCIRPASTQTNRRRPAMDANLPMNFPGAEPAACCASSVRLHKAMNADGVADLNRHQVFTKLNGTCVVLSHKSKCGSLLHVVVGKNGELWLNRWNTCPASRPSVWWLRTVFLCPRVWREPGKSSSGGPTNMGSAFEPATS